MKWIGLILRTAAVAVFVLSLYGSLSQLSNSLAVPKLVIEKKGVNIL